MSTCWDCGGESCTACVGGFRISKSLGLAAGLVLISAVSASGGKVTPVSQVTFERQSVPVVQKAAACAGPSLVGTLNCLLDDESL